MIDPVTGEILNDQTLAERVVTNAKTTGTDLLGPDGALGQLTKNVLEIALEEEMTDHLGYPKHGTSDGSNARNGTRSKTVLTDIGPVQIAVPRDTAGTFTPKIVKKRQRRLSGVDEMVLSLTAHGMTTGEVSAYFAEIYGASVSKDTVSKITDKVIEEMTEWLHRPLNKVYPVIFIDALVVKVRDGQVRNRPIYCVIGVTVDGERDILGLWAGDGAEGAKFWLGVLTDLKNRGVEDVFIAVCDGLKGLPDSINTVWPLTLVHSVHHPPDPQHLQVFVAQVLGQDRQGPAADLYRPERGCSSGQVHRVHRDVGPAVSSDHPALGICLGRVRAVLGLRRRDPTRHLLHERHRVVERPLPARGPGTRSLPERTGRAEVSVSGDEIA